MRQFENKLSSKKKFGKSVKHESALLQVTGRAQYVDDFETPSSLLYAYPVCSTISCGEIVSINTDTAEQAAGVKMILSAQDIPGKKDIGPVFPGDVLLAENEISFNGQPILVIVADSYENARKAARLVNIEYLESIPVLTIEDALEKQHWVRPPYSISRGEIEQGYAQSSHRLKNQVHIGGQEHFYLEGQIALTRPTEDGGLFVQCSTQHPSEVQHLIAHVLNKPFNAVTVEMRRMGGGFGGKETQAAQWAILSALASHKTGCAVKLRLARSDDFKLTGKRHPFLNQYDVGFDEQGLVKAANIIVNGNCGYSPDLSDAIVDRAMMHSDNAYFYENVRITGNRCKTNTVSHTAFRGFGGPQGTLIAEMIQDDIAQALGKDPLDVRLANLYKPGRDITPYHQNVDQFILADMMESLAQSANYRQRRIDIEKFNQQSPIVKKGLALTPVKFGISFTVQHLNQAGALVHVYTDGSIHLNHGGTEMGQGLHTKVAQIVAHEFGVDLDRVAVSATRTDKVPNTSPTAASSGTDLNGMAALNAVKKIKARLIEFIVEHFDTEKQSIHFEDGVIKYQGGEIGFTELVQLAYVHRISLSANGFYATPNIHFDRETGKGRPFFYYSHGAALTEVEIDTLTGENAITKVDILHDVGNSINPAIDIGQIEGAFVQGMGWLTTEDLAWNDAGVLASNSPATYKIPAIGDTPAHFDVQLFDSENPENTVFKSKAVGEPPFMLAISVWCALRDAILSITSGQYQPSLDTPATPEKILMAVMDAKRWMKEKQTEAKHDK
jgi:xanthine dehydrogenase large subunit